MLIFFSRDGLHINYCQATPLELTMDDEYELTMDDEYEDPAGNFRGKTTQNG